MATVPRQTLLSDENRYCWLKPADCILHELSKKRGKSNYEKSGIIIYDNDCWRISVIMSFMTDGTSSSQTISSIIMPIIIIYGFFGIVLLIIGKKGHDSMLSR